MTKITKDLIKKLMEIFKKIKSKQKKNIKNILTLMVILIHILSTQAFLKEDLKLKPSDKRNLELIPFQKTFLVVWEEKLEEDNFVIFLQKIDKNTLGNKYTMKINKKQINCEPNLKYNLLSNEKILFSWNTENSSKDLKYNIIDKDLNFIYKEEISVEINNTLKNPIFDVCPQDENNFFIIYANLNEKKTSKF